MHGNMYEWCSDFFEGDYYASSPVDDPAGPRRSEEDHMTVGLGDHVIRGGASSVPLWRCRSAFRGRQQSRSAQSSIGFRVVAVPETVVTPVVVSEPEKRLQQEVGNWVSRNNGTVECYGQRIIGVKVTIADQQDDGLSRLAELTSLKKLTLSGSPVDGLPKLKNLEELELRGIWVADLSAVEKLKNLTELKLTHGHPASFFGDHTLDVSPLSKLTNLKTLRVEQNPARVRNIGGFGTLVGFEALVNLPNLREVEVRGVSLVRGISSLQKALPKCKIKY
jgi:hypothetical protein